MATTIVTKYGSDAPATTDIVRGELAVDTENGRLYTENAAGAVVEIGLKPEANVDVTGTITATGTSVFTNLDISGDIDVDGTTNLDVVDIDGAVDMASTLAVGGVVTANAGVVVDNITIDGQEIDVSSGDLTLDVAGAITLDADGGQVVLKDGGTQYGNFLMNNSGDLSLHVETQDKDIKFSGNDGGSAITALTLDMSAAGAATFNSDVGIGATPNTYSGYTTLTLGSSSNGGIIDFERNGTIKGEIFTEAAIFGFQTIQADDDIVFRGNDGGSTVTALTLDMSAAGAATFNSSLTCGYLLHMGGGTSSQTVGLVIDHGSSTSYNLIQAENDNGTWFKVAGDGVTTFGNTVGIGTDSPATNLHIQSTSEPAITLYHTGIMVSQIGLDSTGSLTFGIDGSTGATERLRIESSGVLQSNGYSVVASSARAASGTLRLGNIASTSMLLDYDDQSQTIATVRNQYGSTAAAAELSLDSGFITFNTGTSFTEAARFDSSQNFLVGTTVASAGRVVSKGLADGSIYTYISDQSLWGTGAISHINFINGNGSVGAITTNASATAYNTSSDQRLKENIADADDAGSKVDAIQVRKFDWKADGQHQDYGMIAQELIEVAPEAVSGDADSEEMMGVDYSKLVPMLIKEIQQLRQRVAQLEE